MLQKIPFLFWFTLYFYRKGATKLVTRVTATQARPFNKSITYADGALKNEIKCNFKYMSFFFKFFIAIRYTQKSPSSRKVISRILYTNLRIAERCGWWGNKEEPLC